MPITVYGLTYGGDDGSREAWTWGYMPIELFETPELRERRIATLSAENPDYEFDEFDRVVVSEAAEGKEPEPSGNEKQERGSLGTDFLTSLLASQDDKQTRGMSPPDFFASLLNHD